MCEPLAQGRVTGDARGDRCRGPRLSAPGWGTDPAGLPAQIIDALAAGPDVRPGERLNHARGVLLTGSFVAAPEAAAYTTAALMQGSEVRALVRLSNSSARPDIPDDDRHADPRGIGVRLSPADGASPMDLIGHSAGGFPAKTPEAFLAFLQALDRRTAAPEAFRAYLDAHPAAKRFLARRPRTPRSFATERYCTLHAVVLVDVQGRRTAGRMQIEPLPRVAHGDADVGEGGGTDVLRRDIRERVAGGPVRLRLVLQRAGPDDALDDISVPWPDERPRLPLGILALTELITDPEAEARVAFDPGRLPPGIEAAGDPMLAARSAAYRIAVARRT